MKFKNLSINLVVVGFIVFIIYSIWDNILNFLRGTPFKSLSTIGATMSKTEAKEHAESLYVAMNHFGTDEDTIYRVLTDISVPNFNKIYNEFGNRLYDAQLGANGLPILDNELDLFGWINEELNETELEKLRELSPKVFK